jgi:general stress protein YciG
MPDPTPAQNKKGSTRGFASMDAAKQRAIASAGGRAAHRSGHAHEFNTEEARAAGRRGGLARSASRTCARGIERAEIELADGQGVMRVEDVVMRVQDRDPTSTTQLIATGPKLSV